MIAPRLMARSEWEARLRQQGCKPLGDTSSDPPLKTGEWWVTEHDFLFAVPSDGEGRLRPDDWQQMLVVLARLKPLDWDT
jgi:hypothetical protein